jgi:flavorubredoxin
MIARKIKQGVYSLAAIDWDRRLFDELVPTPEGTTYNAYLIQGSERTALIDTVYPPVAGALLDALQAAGVKRLDYIVSNHAEQDHSGSLPAVLERYPEAKVVTNARCHSLIAEALPVAAERFIEIQNGEQLSLGDRNLQFMQMPWVHWPDTMVTYLAEEKILFTCDFFGSHLASSDLYADDEAHVHDAAMRYYAEIMMPFRMQIQKHLERLKELEIDLIAPSHGPVYRRPAFILDLYGKWVSDQAEPQVIIPYVSMYDSTTRMVHYLIDRLMERGMSVKPQNMVEADVGEYAKSLVEASTVIFASPVVLAGPHPDIVSAAYLMNALKPKTRFVGVIGSFGWGGNILANRIKELLPVFKSQIRFFDSVLIKGYPGDEDFKALDRLAEEICRANATTCEIH